MKKITLITLLLISAQSAFSQSYYKTDYRTKLKSVSFQVVPTVLNYDGMKVGYGIGINFKQVLSVNYFHTRDYGKNEERPYMDNRLAGLHISVAQPIDEKIELAGGIRKGALNGKLQKILISGELRYKFNDSWRLAFEYGQNTQQKLASVRLIFNLY